MPARRATLAVLLALGALASAGCGASPPPGSPVPTTRAATATPTPSATSSAPGARFTTSTVTLTVPTGLGDRPFDTPHQLQVPAGWTVSVWARVSNARLEAWTPDGALLVSQPGQGTVTRLVPAADPSAAPSSSVLLSGLRQPHGLAFDGTTLYVAESNQIDAYDYRDGVARGRRTVVGGLPDAKSPELGGAYAHALKSVAVGNDHAVYYSIGSTGNISADDRSADPERATIWRVPSGNGAPAVYAHGVRNGTGLAVAPDGAVWTAVNNRDNIEYPWDQPYDGGSGSAYGKVVQAYVNDHPAEELAKLTPGRDLGWPYCDPDPDVQQGVAGTAYDYTTPPFVRDVETNADGSALDCSTLPPIEQTFGAHSAPLGLSFATVPGLGAGALVGVHGSWNRQPPRPPEVSFFAADGHGGLGTQQTVLGGFQLADGSRWGRPVAAVLGPDDAVYVSDDDAGAVYRLAPAGR